MQGIFTVNVGGDTYMTSALGGGGGPKVRKEIGRHIGIAGIECNLELGREGTKGEFNQKSNTMC